MNGKIQVNSGDISIIAVNVDGKPQDTIPTKEGGKYFESAECDNDAIGSWDRTNWEFKIQNLTKKKTKCTLNFVTGNVVGEQSGANKMEDLLNQESNKETLGTLVEDDYNNIRYIGKNPSNYIYFNCKDSTTQNAENCETWRIIGLMDGIKTTSGRTERLLKIIRNDGLGTYSWDSSNSNVNNGYGVNEWSQADIKTVLNGDYFNGVAGADICYDDDGERTKNCPEWTQVGLKQSARDMIEEVIWNTGTAPVTESTWENINSSILLYMWERSDNTGMQCSTSYRCNDEVERTTTWEGKVGLMYPSDYGYATDGGGDQVKRIQCLYTPASMFYSIGGNCYQNNWLFNSKINQWTMTPAPNSSYASEVFCINIGGGLTNCTASRIQTVRPVVYLKSSVKIIGGTGEEGSPFELKLGE